MYYIPSEELLPSEGLLQCYLLTYLLSQVDAQEGTVLPTISLFAPLQRTLSVRNALRSDFKQFWAGREILWSQAPLDHKKLIYGEECDVINLMYEVVPSSGCI